MTEIKLTIPGDVIPQARPRFSMRGNYPVAYDTEKCKDYKAYIKLIAAQNKPAELLDGALSVEIKVFKAIPNSWSKKKKLSAETNETRPTSKPDLDNTAKTVLDSLTGIIWRDDSQVARLLVEKFYSNEPRAEIAISGA